jgi:tRNA G10  N-methylase Trm11
MLGGTVKIAEIVGHISSVSARLIAPFVKPGSTFGISALGLTKISRHLLEEVKNLSGASRYIEARGGAVLSSVVVEKGHVDEFTLVSGGDGYVVAKTNSVQPFEDWGTRDFGRPYADPKSGMLPPKVSRMAVNIAGIGHEKTLLDPFCGMGTILAEGLLMGWNVVGSDQSADVVEKTRGNLRWLLSTNKLGVTYRLVVSDAVHISQQLDAQSIDAIVTEPFMGSPKIKDVKNTIKGLEKLYIGCFRDWCKVLKPGGIIVMALPIYAINGKSHFVKKVIDMCEVLGYTIKAGPIEYGRPGAIVIRQFYKFVWHT